MSCLADVESVEESLVSASGKLLDFAPGVHLNRGEEALQENLGATDDVSHTPLGAHRTILVARPAHREDIALSLRKRKLLSAAVIAALPECPERPLRTRLRERPRLFGLLYRLADLE